MEEAIYERLLKEVLLSKGDDDDPRPLLPPRSSSSLSPSSSKLMKSSRGSGEGVVEGSPFIRSVARRVAAEVLVQQQELQNIAAEDKGEGESVEVITVASLLSSSSRSKEPLKRSRGEKSSARTVVYGCRQRGGDERIGSLVLLVGELISSPAPSKEGETVLLMDSTGSTPIELINGTPEHVSLHIEKRRKKRTNNNSSNSSKDRKGGDDENDARILFLFTSWSCNGKRSKSSGKDKTEVKAPLIEIDASKCIKMWYSDYNSSGLPIHTVGNSNSKLRFDQGSALSSSPTLTGVVRVISPTMTTTNKEEVMAFIKLHDSSSELINEQEKHGHQIVLLKGRFLSLRKLLRVGNTYRFTNLASASLTIKPATAKEQSISDNQTKQQQQPPHEGSWPSDMTPAQLGELLMQGATISTTTEANTASSTTTSSTTSNTPHKTITEAKRALYPFTDDEKYVLCNLPNKECK